MIAPRCSMLQKSMTATSPSCFLHDAYDLSLSMASNELLRSNLAVRGGDDFGALITKRGGARGVDRGL